MNEWRNTIRWTSCAWGAFLYFLAIALSRESPYWPYGVTLTWQAGLVLALLPLLPGLATGRSAWLIRGMFVAALTPFQSGVLAAVVLGSGALAVRLFRDVRGGVVPNPIPRRVLLAAAAYGLFVAAHVVLEWGSVHTWVSVGFSTSVQYLPVCAAVLTGFAARSRVSETVNDMLRIFLAHAAVLFVYPFIVGHPQLLLSVVNGVLKPVYSVLGYAWTYPWYDPDWNPGSVSIVNYSGVLMTLAAFVTGARALHTRRRRDALFCLLFTLAAFLAENAMAVAATGGALVATLAAAAAYRAVAPRSRFLGWMGGAAATTAVLLLFLFSTYLPGGRYETTHKGHYFAAQCANISERPGRFFFGHGPGAYGSRIAYLRIPADPYSTASILRGTYGTVFSSKSLPANEFTTDFQRLSQQPADWVSESQGLIISGLIAFAAENGLVGVLLLGLFFGLFLVQSQRRDTITALSGADTWAAVLPRLFPPLLLLFLSVFYNYTEIPCISFLAVFLATVPGSGRVREEK